MSKHLGSLAAIRAFLVLFMFIALIPSFAQAQISLWGGASQKGPLPVDQAFKMQATLSEIGELHLEWAIEKDYYLYRDHLKWQVSDGIEIVDEIRQQGVAKDDALFGQVDVWYNTAKAQMLFGRSTEDVAGQASIKVTYQGCWEGGICYPPVTEEIPVSQVPLASGLSWSSSPTLSVPSDPVSDATSLSEHDRFTRVLAGGSFGLILGAFFVAGIALSFTPCVFPMIPILSSIIAGQGKLSTLRALSLSAVYVLAMAVTYTFAGVLAGLFGANLQAAFQNTWVISVFSVLFVLLALSMFGFYELQLPASIQTRLSQASHGQKGGQVTGVAIMGFLSALIVGPCMAAPLAGALIYIGQTGDPLLGGAALFAMSLGMGVPLLLVGASAGKFLPKAGAWMKSIKAGFGVMLLLLAVWMLDRIVPTSITMSLTALILIITAVYLKALDRLEHPTGASQFWKGVGVVLLVYGVALILGVLSGARSLLYPLQASLMGTNTASAQMESPLSFTRVTSLAELEPLLVSAKEENRKVLLDYYADWCVTCAEMEYITFVDSGVVDALKDFTLIKVDVTDNSADSRALYREYQVFGPPALVFFDGKGVERKDLAVHGVIQPQPLLQKLSFLNP